MITVYTTHDCIEGIGTDHSLWAVLMPV